MLFNLEPATLVARIIVLVVAFTIHEFAHAWSATQFGDDTPRLNGRLTLNPLAHLDPMGSIVLLFSGFGWAKPVPVNPYALERRSRYAFMWVALAGPMSNLLLAVLAAIPFQLGLVSLSSLFSPSSGYLPSFSLVVFEFVTINLVLMVFNLIPLAPLDGEKILYHLVPYSFRTTMDVIRPYGPMILILLIIAGPYIGLNFFGLVLGPAVSALRSLLIGF
jgi:Zn-dependent protease